MSTEPSDRSVYIMMFVAFTFFVGTCWLVVHFEVNFLAGMAAIIVSPIIGLLIGVFTTLPAENRKLKEIATKRAADLVRARYRTGEVVNKHLDTLARKRDLLVRIDSYGVVDGSAWNKEVQHFVDKVIRPTLTNEEAQAIAASDLSGFFQKHVEDKVAEYSRRRELPDALPVNITPLEFEGRCAAILQREGWDASTTSATGDQGADVVASKDGKRLVIQCKLYSAAVGNKAVQEVIAAKHYYSADVAAVVSKGVFTKSAISLAQAAAVHLLEFNQLSDFAKEISQPDRLARRS